MRCKRIGVVSQPRGILACWQIEREGRVSAEPAPRRGVLVVAALPQADSLWIPE